MKESTTNKKNHVIQAILSILVVILLIAVYLQGEKLSKFIEGLGEKTQTEIETGGNSREKAHHRMMKSNIKRKFRNLRPGLLTCRKSRISWKIPSMNMVIRRLPQPLKWMLFHRQERNLINEKALPTCIRIFLIKQGKRE